MTPSVKTLAAAALVLMLTAQTPAFDPALHQPAATTVAVSLPSVTRDRRGCATLA